MFISADQVLCHMIGDYLLQSDWMANNKTKRSVAAICHVATYGLPFLFLRPSLSAYMFIVITHFIIDRWRLARYVIWVKNFIGLPTFTFRDVRGEFDGRYDGIDRTMSRPVHENMSVAYEDAKRIWHWPNKPWRECAATGYTPETPVWLAVWLMIIADNIMHLICNAIALKYLN